MSEMGDLLWQPSERRVEQSNLANYMAWLSRQGRTFPDYEALRQWSCSDLDGFWHSLVRYFELDGFEACDCVLDTEKMPGSKWFNGAKVNFARHMLAQGEPNRLAIFARSETGPARKYTWRELNQAVRAAAQGFRALGVRKGDRIASYLPNLPETAIAYLGALSIGAVWSSCSPEFGHASVVDRFSQISPKLLLATDSYRFANKVFDRRDEVTAVANALPGLARIIHVAGPAGEQLDGKILGWAEFMAAGVNDAVNFNFEETDFSDPLWIVYSSGTTGLPKPFVHSHGGVLLEALKFMHFHMDLKPSSTLFYFTTTGWVMWNILMNGLLTGGSVVLYDGAPMLPDEPGILWQLAGEAGITFFGASPTFVGEQAKRNIVPNRNYDVSAIDSMLLGGSPVMPEHMDWCFANLGKDIWITSQSGGTDVASAFVGGCPLLPVRAGEIQCRCLGVDAHAFDIEGKSVTDEIGELVVRKPMPSMPLKFWNDEDFSRYRESYFEEYPGVWRHGDYFKVNAHGGCFILGRSDSTLNRYGVRIGTAEIYRTVEAIDEIDDSLIVNIDLPDGGFYMPLFVKLASGEMLTDTLKAKVNSTLKTIYSPRHVPEVIFQVDDIPYTLTGKKLEVPVRKILAGADPEKAVSRDAMANPTALQPFLKLAAELTATRSKIAL